MDVITMAFLLTILAGLSTGIGSTIAFFLKDNKNLNFLSLSMSFAAGVMLYVSFVEIFPHATHELVSIYEGHQHWGHFVAVLCFFAGMLVVALIDKLIPHDENPHEIIDQAEVDSATPAHRTRLMRIGLLTALALAIHNFPEGIATFTATLDDVNLGVSIAIAIALHNIPEGIAVSMPIYYATGSRSKAFWYSFLSGLVEPLGAFIGYALFGSYMTPGSPLLSCLLASVAGIMVFISLDQLLPTAEKYGKHHLVIYGMMAGMAMMAMSLLMMPHEH